MTVKMYIRFAAILEEKFLEEIFGAGDAIRRYDI